MLTPGAEPFPGGVDGSDAQAQIMDECEHVHQWQHLEIGQVMTAAHAFCLLPRILLSSLVIEVQHIIL